MALSKEHIGRNGITTNYHKITRVSLGRDILNCELSSYVTKEYRENELHADSSFFRFNITLEEEEAMGIRQLAYTKIKALPEWADAEDC